MTATVEQVVDVVNSNAVTVVPFLISNVITRHEVDESNMQTSANHPISNASQNQYQLQQCNDDYDTNIMTDPSFDDDFDDNCDNCDNYEHYNVRRPTESMVTTNKSQVYRDPIDNGDDTSTCTNDDIENMSHHELTLCYEINDAYEEQQQQLSSNITASSIPSFFDHLDVMFEKLCYSDSSVVDDLTTDTNARTPRSYSNKNNYMDTIMNLLGCYTLPSISELDCFSSIEMQLLFCIDSQTSATSPIDTISTDHDGNAFNHRHQAKRPQRRGRSIKRRVVDQLLQDRGRKRKSQTDDTTLLRRTHSFSIIHDQVLHQKQIQQDKSTQKTSSYHNLWEQFALLFHKKSQMNRPNNELIPHHIYDMKNTDGYDSDPELTATAVKLPAVQKRSVSPRSITVDLAIASLQPDKIYVNIEKCNVSSNLWYETHLLRAIIDDAMNQTWDLIWIHDDKPIQIKAWIERGTIIHSKSSAMVEPCLMWRCVSPPTSPTCSSLMTTPESIRLLQICRVLPASSYSRNAMTSIYGQQPMYRTSTSLVLRTIYHDTLIFQAPTVEERDSIIYQWKVVIARLATFAVLEDNQPLIEEFFLNKNSIYEYY